MGHSVTLGTFQDLVSSSHHHLRSVQWTKVVRKVRKDTSLSRSPLHSKPHLGLPTTPTTRDLCLSGRRRGSRWWKISSVDRKSLSKGGRLPLSRKNEEICRNRLSHSPRIPSVVMSRVTLPKDLRVQSMVGMGVFLSARLRNSPPPLYTHSHLL